MQRDWEEASYEWAVRGLALVAVLLLIAPTIIVVATSFTGGSTLKFPPPSWSVRWYLALADSPQIIDAALFSLKAAVIATLGTAIFGTLAAVAIARSNSGVARLLDAVFMSPMVLPGIALGLALLMLLSVSGVRLSIWTLAAGHVVVCVPFVLRMVGASMQQLSVSLEESSASLGANRVYTFLHVTLPLIKPGIFAGSFIAFMSSFDNVPISLFLGDARNEVLPIHMWNILEGSLDVRVAAVSGVLVAFTVVAMILMERLAGVSRQVRSR
jgi:putative spermidine/putrescine transport system permease protein